MAHRNFSMIEYFNRLAAEHRPLLAFEGSTLEDFEAWQPRARQKYFELLGEWPRPVDPAPEVEWRREEDGLIRERLILDTEAYMSVPCLVLRPVDMPEDRSGAAILCSHGHGAFGKEPVAGNRSTPELIAKIAEHNYNYGEQMARAGYLTLSPDLRCFGERSDGGDPWPGRDPCNVNFIRGSMLGLNTLTLNIWDMLRCVDYLQTRPEVNPERLGMMGLSQGGVMTTFTTAAEPRIKCADIIGYLNPFEGFALQRGNFCGSQMLPHLYKWLDTSDVAGLICPRPLLLEEGEQDQCFFIDDLRAGAAAARRIYEAAGVGDRLWEEVHPGGHQFAGKLVFDFFAKYL